MSLGTWFKEYVYIPLGGSREGSLKLIRNLLIVWMLTGFWHGANWNFIIWGLYFGIILIIEKFFLLGILEKLPKLMAHAYSLVIIIFGWVIFAFEDISKIRDFGRRMFGFTDAVLIDSNSIYLFKNNLFLLILCSIMSTRLIRQIRNYALESKFKQVYILGESIGFVLVFILALSFLIGSSYNPFLYFKF